MNEETAESATPLRCSVIIPTWKRPDLLAVTLSSVLNQNYPHLEVVVVSDGDDPDLRDLSQAFKNEQRIIWTFHATNRGASAARNTGARQACGEVLLFLDDDVIADRELVTVHMQYHRHFPPQHRLAVISLTAEDRHTKLLSYVDERMDEIYRQMLESFSHTLKAAGEKSVGEEVEEILWFGLNSSIRRQSFLSVGGFNEDLGSFDEDMELGLRLYHAGVHFVFEPRLLLTHKNCKSPARYFRNSWKASGRLNAYRVLERGQKNAQTRRLGSVFNGYFANRLIARTHWHFAGSVRRISEFCERAANRTRSRWMFALWGRTALPGEYWSSAKAAGCSLEKLKNAAGSSHIALTLNSLSAPASDAEASYYISPHRFNRMMRWFVAAGYKTATTAQWLKDELPKKHVLLTFDDGYDDLHEHFLPLAIEHHLTAVVFLVADHVAGSNVWDQKSGLRARNLLTWPQIREMQKYGIEFGSHTLTHPFLPDISHEQLRCELVESKRHLEDALGVEVTSFAYPYGGVDRRVRSAVIEAGYKLAFTTLPGPNWWNDPFCQLRAEVNEHTSLLDFGFQLRTGYGFTQSISERLGALERDLPLSALRGAASTLRSFGRYVRHDFGRGSKGGAQR